MHKRQILFLFYPYATGNMWEYLWAETGYADTLQTFISEDSVGRDGRIHVTKRSRFINPTVSDPEWPRKVSIDTSLKQVWGDLGYGLGILYKLTAQRGDQWIASRRVGVLEMCRVVGVEEDTLLGQVTTIKQFHFYLTADSTDTTGYTVNGFHALASGFGLIYRGGGELFHRLFLKGAVIEGVLYGDTTRVLTRVADSPLEHPTQFQLHQNFPNPFNPSTTITFSLPTQSNVRLTIHDLLGREVVSLVNETRKAGYYLVDWNASGVSSGVYFFRFSAGNFSAINKMVVAK